MIDPKLFYRRMDALLAQITLQEGDDSFVPSILAAFEQAFGDSLHLTDGRLYEERDQHFVEIGGPDTMGWDHPFLLRVLSHGSYIFDRPVDGMVFPDGVVPAAFYVIRSHGRRWLFTCSLTEGWSREEISFAMNAVRFALNSRLQAEATRNDLQQASEIQQSLLPTSLPDLPGYDFAARSTPAEEVGGDFYDFIRVDEDVLGVSIGDASGHGLPAALMVRDVMTGIRMGMETQLKLLHTLKKLNRVVHRSAYTSRFISVFYAEIEPNGNLLYANAGHTSPLLIRANGDVESLDPTGTILGPLPEIHLERAYVRMAPGDIFVLFTDGIIERFDSENRMFDVEGLTRAVADYPDATSEELLNHIFERSLAFSGSEGFDDDATVVVIRRLKDVPKPRRRR